MATPRRLRRPVPKRNDWTVETIEEIAAIRRAKNAEHGSVSDPFGPWPEQMFKSEYLGAWPTEASQR